ncbi:1035_t:CDS:1, partial [Acaulospora morrowiae]
PWTLSIEIVIRFLRLFVVEDDLFVNFIVGVDRVGVSMGLIKLGRNN